MSCLFSVCSKFVERYARSEALRLVHLKQVARITSSLSEGLYSRGQVYDDHFFPAGSPSPIGPGLQSYTISGLLAGLGQ